MNAFGMGEFGPGEARNAPIDVYTSAYRVSGETLTRFTRIADILNQLTATHLIVEHATVSEFADPAATIGALQVHVAIDDILFAVGGQTDGAARPEMRIPKRPVRAQLALPPFRLTGMVHVPQGSRPVDGLFNVGDRFVAMTEATVVSGAHPELGRSADAIAIQRRLAHLVLVTDDERPDELLASVLDRDTAERWLRQGEAGREGVPEG